MPDRSGHVEDRALKFGLFAIVSTSVDDLEFFSSLFNFSRTLSFILYEDFLYACPCSSKNTTWDSKVPSDI